MLNTLLRGDTFSPVIRECSYYEFLYLEAGIEMNIAIMGAGLSGLACALTLEKNGISPTIFEKRSRVGDIFVNGEVLLSIFNFPVHDCIKSLSEEYGIDLKPTAAIMRLKLFSKNEKALIEGDLGFSNTCGRHQNSFESQLGQQTKSTIHYNSEKTYEQLASEYSHVVMATGDGDYAKETKNYREDLTVSIKGAAIEGDFDRYTVMAWVKQQAIYCVHT